MGKPFISQNITLATGGFTYENGILTPAEAKTIYNLNVPSNVLVSANGLLWIKLNSTKTAAQIGWTDVDGTNTPDGFGWPPIDTYGDIRLNIELGDHVDIGTNLAELQTDRTSIPMDSPLGNAILHETYIPDRTSIYKTDVYTTPVFLLIVNNISVPNKKWTCTQCDYVDEAIMPPIKCPVCKGTDFVTT